MNKKKSFERQLKDEQTISSELRIANAYIQDIFRQAPVTIVIYKGNDFVVEVANDAALEMWGKTEREVSYKPFFKISPELKNTMEPIMQKVMQTGEPFIGKELPVQYIRHGKIYSGFFDFTYQPSYDVNNKIDGIIAVGTDVTASIEARKKIEESAIENSKLAAIVTSSQDAIISKTLEGIITSWNPGAQKLFGYSEREMLGQSITKLIPTDRLFEEQNIINKIQSGQIVDHFETKRVDKHGNLIDISLTISPIKNSEGKIIGASKIARDITQARQAQEALRVSEEKYRSLFNGMDEGYCVIEFFDGAHGELSDYVHIEANHAYAINTGIPDIVGRNVREMVPDEADGWVEIYRNVLITGKPVRFERELVATGRHLELFSFRIEPPELKQVAVLFKDISERKRAEQQIRENEKQLRELSASLEQKVARRTAELEEKNIELQKINKELESFTYISSHDLQEPLRKIQAFAGRIIAKEKEHLSPTAKDYFERMNNAATRMQTLLRDLLTFSRVNTAERKFETTNLRLILEEVKDDLKESITEKNATIEIGNLHEVKIIPFQFRQLFQNLISNSLKFSKPDTPPHIAIRSEIVSGGESLTFEGDPVFHIIYRDNGIGFEEHFSEKIFEVFQKLHGKDEYTGTGIGLAIVKKIVEIHHGQITAKGKLGEGAQFDIFLPVV